MPSERTRRSLLRATATAVAASGTAALAGCSSIDLLGDDGEPTARDWLYDPTAFDAEPNTTIQFQSPSRLVEASAHLHSDVRKRFDGPLYGAIERTAVDWLLREVDDLLKAPLQTTVSGSFDADAAREAATALLGTTDPSDAGSVGDLTHLANGDDRHAGVRNGLLVGVQAADGSGFERLVEGAENGEDRLLDVGDGIGSFVDALGLRATTQAGVFRRDGTWRGVGSSYQVDGETTTLRYVLLNRRVSEGDLQSLGRRIDGLRDVSVETDGSVAKLTGVADTNRVGLQGAAFEAEQLPYE